MAQPKGHTGSQGWIEVGSVYFAKSDSFQFNDTSAGKQSGPVFSGGVFVQAGDVNDIPPHTPEWTNPHGADPVPPPTGTVTFFINGSSTAVHDDYAGAHALYQDVMIPV